MEICSFHKLKYSGLKSTENMTSHEYVKKLNEVEDFSLPLVLEHDTMEKNDMKIDILKSVMNSMHGK